jgi:hypothetical protein
LGIVPRNGGSSGLSTGFQQGRVDNLGYLTNKLVQGRKSDPKQSGWTSVIPKSERLLSEKGRRLQRELTVDKWITQYPTEKTAKK